MFYSIAINYSIYAFNEDDYEQEYITKQRKMIWEEVGWQAFSIKMLGIQLQ